MAGSFGYSSSNSYLAATQAVTVSPTGLGISSALAVLGAAALSLTITGGVLGDSSASGALAAAALDLSMLSNFQGSTSAGGLASTVQPRLAEYAEIIPAVPLSYWEAELDFTAWDGTTEIVFSMDAGGGSSSVIIGTSGPFTAGEVPYPISSTGFYVPEAISATVMKFVGTTELVDPQATLTDYVGGGAHTQVTMSVTNGVLPVDAIMGLVTEGSDGFVVDVPLWPGLREVALITASSTGELRSETKAMTLYDIGRAVYALWGYDGIKDLRTIEIGRDRLVQWCNAAMQLIYSQAARLEFFNRERLEVTVPSSGSVALPSSVQKIMGSARISDRYLRPLESKAQVTNFAALYGGTVPIAFLVESLRDAAADSLAMTLYLAPPPSGDTVVSLDVTKEPPRYDAVDILNGTVLQIPHKWAETIFKPLVMKWAAGDGRMPKSARAAQIQEIDAQYATAREMLGLADIDPVNVKTAKEVTKEV